MKFPAVIFDLDGTLLNTLEDMADAMNGFLREEKLTIHPVNAYKHFIGDGLRTLVERVLPVGPHDEILVNRGLEGFVKQYQKNWHTKTRPYDGIKGLLGELALRKIKMAIFSNKPDEFTQRVVAHYFPGREFIAVQGAKPNVPKKPDPRVPLEMARHMNVPPEFCAYVGDSGTDMKTAQAAGMFPIGVAWGFRSVDEIRENGARVVVYKPEDLLGFF